MEFRKDNRPVIVAADYIATSVSGFAVSLSRSQKENACRQAADGRMGTPSFKFICSLAKFIDKSWDFPCPLLYRVKERNTKSAIPKRMPVSFMDVKAT